MYATLEAFLLALVCTRILPSLDREAPGRWIVENEPIGVLGIWGHSGRDKITRGAPGSSKLIIVSAYSTFVGCRRAD